MAKFAVRSPRRRAAPHIVVEIRRRLAVGRIAPVAHVVVAANFGVGDVAEQALCDDLLAGLHEVRRAAALRAHLHDAIVFAGSSEHRLALDDVDARRLLHVHIATGLDGSNHWQCVPMIRCADEHEVEFIFLEQRSVIAVGLRAFARFLPFGHNIGCAGKHCAVDVGQRHYLDGGDLDESEQIHFAIPTGADQRHALGRAFGDIGRSRGDGGVSQTSRAGSQKSSTVHPLFLAAWLPKFKLGQAPDCPWPNGRVSCRPCVSTGCCLSAWETSAAPLPVKR